MRWEGAQSRPLSSAATPRARRPARGARALSDAVPHDGRDGRAPKSPAGRGPPDRHRAPPALAHRVRPRGRCRLRGWPSARPRPRLPRPAVHRLRPALAAFGRGLRRPAPAARRARGRVPGHPGLRLVAYRVGRPGGGLPAGRGARRAPGARRRPPRRRRRRPREPGRRGAAPRRGRPGRPGHPRRRPCVHRRGCRIRGQPARKPPPWRKGSFRSGTAGRLNRCNGGYAPDLVLSSWPDARVSGEAPAWD